VLLLPAGKDNRVPFGTKSRLARRRWPTSETRRILLVAKEIPIVIGDYSAGTVEPQPRAPPGCALGVFRVAIH
jgi:hypothetical protein